MFPAVGALRASGTTVILEDVAFPVEKLGDAIIDLQGLFKKYGYENAIIFGHAKDGNIHFVVTQSFDTKDEVQRYADFLDEVVELVVKKYDGTLKAEHGTGRNMAPFVETEWGSEVYQIMKAVKELIDPENLLNPGVIINADKKAHIANLKELPKVEEEVDRCMECGFCEHKCPSRNLTLTPRRRIVVRRELQKFKRQNNKKDYKTLLNQYQYHGLDTCNSHTDHVREYHNNLSQLLSEFEKVSDKVADSAKIYLNERKKLEKQITEKENEINQIRNQISALQREDGEFKRLKQNQNAIYRYLGQVELTLSQFQEYNKGLDTNDDKIIEYENSIAKMEKEVGNEKLKNRERYALNKISENTRSAL